MTDREVQLFLADLATVEKRRERVTKQAKVGDKAAKEELELLDKLQAAFDDGKPARLAGLTDDEKAKAYHLFLLTMKPMIADVESFVLVDPSGSPVTCSRDERVPVALPQVPAVDAEPLGRAGCPSGPTSGMRATSASRLAASARSMFTIDTLFARTFGTITSRPSGVTDGISGWVGSNGSSVPTRTRATSARSAPALARTAP